MYYKSKPIKTHNLIIGRITIHRYICCALLINQSKEVESTYVVVSRVGVKYSTCTWYLYFILVLKYICISNYDSLFVRTVAFPVQVAYWIKEVIAPCGTSVPCQLWPVVRRHGRGVLLTGGDPCMTGCLECPLASPVFAQSWSQTATDGAWYSTTALLSGRDRPRCLCVLRLSGSKPKTRRTGKVATSLPSISLPVSARW